MNRLLNKVAVVTGAGAGIGRETALLFAAEGARVACIDINKDGAAETAQIVSASNGSAKAIHADVSDWSAAESLRNEVLESFGHVHILINNAGGDASGDAQSLTITEWSRGFKLNLDGAFLLSKAFWPDLLAAGGASIVNTSSIMGLRGDEASVAYCSAKAALIGLTKALAADGARHAIRVNCVCPGFVDTAAIWANIGPPGSDQRARHELARKLPMGRVGKPGEIAQTFLFLASDAASYMTGAVLVVDGGASLGYKGSDVGG